MFKTIKNVVKGDRVLSIEVEQGELVRSMVNMERASQEWISANEKWIKLDLERETLLTKRKLMIGGGIALGGVVAYGLYAMDKNRNEIEMREADAYEQGYLDATESMGH